MRNLLLAIACSSIFGALLLSPSAALAWGNTGHRMIGQLAIRALPGDLPAFIRSPQAVEDVGEFSREPDRIRGGGKIYDADHTPAHYIDIDDQGLANGGPALALGGPALAALPTNRAGYEAALQAVGQDSWKAGYLPYSIMEAYQQLAQQFAYWRVLKAGEANPKWRAHRAWFKADRLRRERQILIVAGELGHFVGDGSQPLHVTNHFNGWGPFPNPRGYTTAHIHGPFESDLVQAGVRQAAVGAAMAPFHDCGCPIEQRTADYLTATWHELIPLYELEKVGGIAPGDPRGTAFATARMAVGASELRDLIALAWKDSLAATVGWKPVAVSDVLAGRVDPYPALYGVD